MVGDTDIDTAEMPLYVAALCDDFQRLHLLLDYDKKKIDVPDSNGKTPLMLAVSNNCYKAVDILLDYGADIDIQDTNGKSALQMVFSSCDIDCRITQGFLNRVKMESDTTAGLVGRLFVAGCTLCHAVLLKDIELLTGLLLLGSDVDSRDPSGKTPLHIAAEMNEFEILKLFLEFDADVNALDENGCGPLCIAAAHGNPMIVKWLLEYGADPNVKAFECGLTPLIAVMGVSCEQTKEQYDECAELLLLHGAVPSQKIGKHRMVFDEALLSGSFYRIDLVICDVALREMKGESIAEKIIQCKLVENQEALPQILEYYGMCQELLNRKTFGSLSLFDLLSASDHKLRVYMRNKSVYAAVKKSLEDHSVIYETHPYYHILLTDCLERIPDSVSEDEAIAVICQCFNSEYNQLYVFAKGVMEYLDKLDIESICQ